MAEPLVQFQYEGDTQRAQMFRGAGQALLAKLRDAIKFNDLQTHSLQELFEDGTVVTVTTFFGQQVVNINSPVVEPVQPVVEEKQNTGLFIIIFCVGVEMYIPPSSPPGSWYVQPAYMSDSYAIVYDPTTRAYAKILDPVPADADDDGYIKFPCTQKKINDWFQSCAWVSKKNMDASERKTADNYKVWNEQFVFTDPNTGLPWGPNKSITVSEVNCDCPSYPTNYAQLPCFYEVSWQDSDNVWVCLQPSVSDLGGCDYMFLAGPNGEELLSAYSCESGGYCNFTGNAGYGGSWKLVGELSGTTANDTMVSITPGSQPGGGFDYNAYGLDYFGAAKLICQYKSSIISSYEHERNQASDTQASANHSSQYYGDDKDFIYIGSSIIHALHHVGQWVNPYHYTYSVGNIIHTPIGSKASTEEGSNLIKTDQGVYHTKSYPLDYIHEFETVVEDTSSYDASRNDDFIPDITQGDYNYVNCNRAALSLTTQKQEILFQLYMWHYMVVHTTDETHGRTANTGTTTHTLSHSWGHTLIAQAEFANKENPNPLLREDYKKNDPNTDFAFNTPELETQLEELIAKVYSGTNDGFPLVLTFDPYIVSAPVDANGNPTATID